MLQKSKKEEMIKDLEKAVKGSESVVFVNFHGMNVGNETILCRELRDQGVGYKVSRKTLLKRALVKKQKGKFLNFLVKLLLHTCPAEVLTKVGSKDGSITPREIYNFQKTHKGILDIFWGIFEGKFVGKEKMMEIAVIPS